MWFVENYGLNLETVIDYNAILGFCHTDDTLDV